MIEVEIKAKIANPEFLKKEFEKHDGKYLLSLNHEDTYFNMPKKLRNFKKTDEALRIRKSIEFHKNQKDSNHKTKFYLTYKGKKIDTTTKSRNEVETEVSNGKQLKDILKSLGFREIFTVKKERELYKFNYNNRIIEVLIDYIPILDEYFIEVELLVNTKPELNGARAVLFNFLSLFGIRKKDSIRLSYLELIAEKFKRKKL